MARDFNGTSDEITTVSLPFTDSGGLSLACWVKSSGTHGNLDALLSEGFAGGDITIDFRSPDWKFHVGTKFTPGWSEALTDGNWHYVLCTYLSGVSGHIRTYVDDMVTADADDTSDMGSFSNPSSIFRIGNLSTLPRFFVGTIAEVKVWDVVLNEGERKHAKAGMITRTDQLLGYWPLYGISSPEPDLSGNINNGTLVGTTGADHAPVGRHVPMPRYRPEIVLGGGPPAPAFVPRMMAY